MIEFLSGIVFEGSIELYRSMKKRRSERGLLRDKAKNWKLNRLRNDDGVLDIDLPEPDERYTKDTND